MSVTFISLRRFVVNSLLIFAFSVINEAWAAPLRVTIDVGTIVECKDVTPKEYAETHTQQRVVEAKVRLSVLLQSGHEADLEQLQVAIGSPDRRMRVVDFQPRTELGSELAGDVEVCNSNDMVQSLNASLGGVVGADHGPAHVQASPAAGVGVTQNRGSKETFHRLSPKQTVLVSGTTNAEHGVFFKWRHSTQVALEGSREVTIRFLVPHDWRGDWLEFQAEMLGRHRNYLGEKVEPVGQAQVFLALYRMGDGASNKRRWSWQRRNPGRSRPVVISPWRLCRRTLLTNRSFRPSRANRRSGFPCRRCSSCAITSGRLSMIRLPD